MSISGSSATSLLSAPPKHLRAGKTGINGCYKSYQSLTDIHKLEMHGLAISNLVSIKL